MCEQRDDTPKPQPRSHRLWWEPGEGKEQGCGQQGKGPLLCSAIPKCWCRGGHLGRRVTPGSPSTSPGFLLAAPSASAVVLSYWSSESGWDNPRPLRGTVWPPINLGANPPFKPFPVNAKVGHYDLKYSFAHCPSTSFLNSGTLSCLCCWRTCYFFRDRAGSLVIVTLIGDKVQSKN